MKIIAANLFGVVTCILLSFINFEVYGHGAIVDGGSEGVGPLIFIPVLVAFGLFVIFANRKKGWSVLVVGGAGYLGSALVVKLLNRGDRVTVLDPFEFDDEILLKVSKNLDLRQVKGTVSNNKAVDEALDAAVQRAIRRTFRDATVVCIAHRINTISDYDRVLVLDDGEVVEDGVPAVLARDPQSVFGGLARSHDEGV